MSDYSSTDWPPRITFTAEGIAGLFLLKHCGDQAGGEAQKELGALLQNAYDNGFNAGMTRAAELCRVEAEIHPANDYLLGKEAGCNDCADAIIKARDGE